MTHRLAASLTGLKMQLSRFSQQTHQEDLSETDRASLEAQCASLKSTVDALAEETSRAKPNLAAEWLAIKAFADEQFRFTEGPSTSRRSLTERLVTINSFIDPIIAALSEDVLGASRLDESYAAQSLDESTIIGYQSEYSLAQLEYFLRTTLTRETNEAIFLRFLDTHTDFILILRNELKHLSNPSLYPTEIRDLFEERSPQIFNKERLIGLVLLICLFDHDPSAGHQLKATTTIERLISISSLEKSRFLELCIEIKIHYKDAPARDLITRYILGEELPGLARLPEIQASLDFNKDAQIFRSEKTRAEDNTFLFSLLFQDVLNHLKPPERKREKILRDLAKALETLDSSVSLQNRDIRVLDELGQPRRLGSSDLQGEVQIAPLHQEPELDDAPIGDYADFERELNEIMSGNSTEGSGSEDSGTPVDPPIAGREPSPPRLDPELALSEREVILDEAYFTEEAETVLHHLIALYMSGFKRDFLHQCRALQDHRENYQIISALVVCFSQENVFDDAQELVRASGLNPVDQDSLFSYIAEYFLRAPWLLSELNALLVHIHSEEIARSLMQRNLQNIPTSLNAILYIESESQIRVVDDFQLDQLTRFLDRAAEESSRMQNQLEYDVLFEFYLTSSIISIHEQIRDSAFLYQNAKNILLFNLFRSCPAIFCHPIRINTFEGVLASITDRDLQSRLVIALITLDVDTLKLPFFHMHALDISRSLLSNERVTPLAYFADILVMGGQVEKAFHLIYKLHSVFRKTRVFDYASQIIYMHMNNPKAATTFLEAAKRPIDPGFMRSQEEERLAPSDHHQLLYAWTKLLLADGRQLSDAFEHSPEIFKEEDFATLQFFQTLFADRAVQTESLRSSVPDSLASTFQSCKWMTLRAIMRNKGQNRDRLDPAPDETLSRAVSNWVEKQPLDQEKKNLLYYHIIHYLVVSEKLPTSFSMDPLDALMDRITDVSLKDSLETTLFAYFEWDSLLHPHEIFSDRSILMNHLVFIASQRQDRKTHGDDVNRYFSMGRHRFSGTVDSAAPVLTYFAQKGRRDIPREYQAALPILAPHLEEETAAFWQQPVDPT